MEKTRIPVEDRTEPNMAETEARNGVMLSAIPDLVFRMTVDGTYLDMHVPTTAGSLVAAGAEIGANIADVLPDDVASEALRIFREVVESGDSQRIEYALDLDGEWVYFESRVEPSGPSEVITLVRDVSRWVLAERERAHAEALLQESEARYRELVNTLPDGVYRSTPDGQLLEVNPAFVKMLGYDTKDEVLALDVATEVYVDGERNEVISSQQLGSHVATFRNQRKDGSVIWVEDHGSFVLDEEGNVLFHEGIIRDITQRIETERALVESERRFRELFDQSAQLAALLATDGTLLAANHAARRYLAEDESAGVGRPLCQSPWWSHSVELQEQLRGWVAKAAEGESTSYEVFHPDHRGELRRVAGALAPLRDPEGRVEYIVLTGFDVTESWRLRQEVLDIAEQERARIGRELHDGLGQQLTGLGLMARALERRLEARKSGEAAAIRQFRDLVQQALNYTRHLSRDLLPIPLQKGGLSEALEDLALNASELFGLPVRASIEPAVHLADSDAALHMYQIARESVTNAARHANADYIGIGLQVAADHTTLSVIDNGIGMPAEDEQGEGIGVPTMRYRARQIGATLDMRPSVSGGTLVECILPVGRGDG